MPRKLTEYNVLFSCPGDAYKTCYTVIQEAVTDFNKYAKSNLSISVNLTHWSTDSYPQSGGHPQALLNTQIVDNADAAIAVFWTRFGTPTDEFGSGTEEEIERFLNDNKQVFLYFLDKAIPPSVTDSDAYREQRMQITSFRRKYEEKGIFWVVADETVLKEQFSQHLFLFFASQISRNTGTQIDNEKSALVVTATDGTTEMRIQHLNLSDEMEIESQRCLIMTKIEDVKKIDVPSKIALTAPEKAHNASEQIYGSVFAEKDAKIEENERVVVLDFCKENEMSIEDNFWHLGNLKINANRISLPFGGSFGPALSGSDDEERKYNLLIEIISEIYHYNDRKLYCHAMDEIPYAELIVQNKGTAFDEDIEIKLSIPGGSLLTAEEFPMPIFDLEQINEEDRLREWICPIATADISEFDFPTAGYNPPTFTPQIPIMPFQTRNYNAEFNQSKEEYVDSIKAFFDWEVFKSQDSDIVKIHINKLNQYKAMHFPARLFFAAVPEKIGYIVTAKYTPRIIEGEINVYQ